MNEDTEPASPPPLVIDVPFDAGQFLYSMSVGKAVRMTLTVDPCFLVDGLGRKCDSCARSMENGDEIRTCTACANALLGHELCAECHARGDVRCRMHPAAAFGPPVTLAGVTGHRGQIYVHTIGLGLRWLNDAEADDATDTVRPCPASELERLAASAVGLPFLVALAHRQLVDVLAKAGVARGTLLRLLLAAGRYRNPALFLLLTELATRMTLQSDVEAMLMLYAARILALLDICEEEAEQEAAAAEKAGRQPAALASGAVVG